MFDNLLSLQSNLSGEKTTVVWEVQKWFLEVYSSAIQYWLYIIT